MNEFLTKIFDTNPSKYCNQTNWNLNNLESLWFHDFSSKSLFLVSCYHFCSSFLTEDLTGLLQILSSDWLNRRTCCFHLFHIKWVRKSSETSIFSHFTLIFLRKSQKKLISELYFTHTTFLSTKASRMLGRMGRLV